jgi:hypothetical protein
VPESKTQQRGSLTRLVEAAKEKKREDERVSENGNNKQQIREKEEEMLSDFYLPSPLPPLPFQYSSKDCVDDMTLPSDDLSHASLLFDEQAGLSLPPLLATRSSHHKDYYHSALLLEEEEEEEDNCSMELTRALAGIDDEEGVTTSPAHHLLHDQPDFSSSSSSSSSASSSSSSPSSSASNYLQPTTGHQPTSGAPSWHPECPACMASGHVAPAGAAGIALLAEDSGREGSPATAATALRSPVRDT